MQAQNLITCVEAGVKAALMRRESRGFHIRTDCPEVDNHNWVERITVSEKNGKMALSKRKPVCTTLPPDSRKHANIMNYALECEKDVRNHNPSHIMDE